MQKKSFSLDSAFYKKDILIKAQADFKDFSIELKDGTITTEDENPELIFDEFCNYILALSNEELA